MIKINIKKRIALLAAGLSIAVVGVFATPASAATIENGHIQSVPVSLAGDWDARVTWSTDYNAVGTSSTIPTTLSFRQQGTGPTNADVGKSFQITFRKANGGLAATKTFNCLAPFTLSTTWASCSLGNWTHIQLIDAPTVVVKVYSGTNLTGRLETSFTYQYK